MNLIRNPIKMDFSLKFRIIGAGSLMIFGLMAGVLSVAPAIDSNDFLTLAASNRNQVFTASLWQFVLALVYVGVAVLLYPILKISGRDLAIGFLSFRLIAANLMIIGTALLLSILALSSFYEQNQLQSPLVLEGLGAVLKSTRDYINHVHMVLVLCISNLMFYLLLLRSGRLVKWLPIWGIVGAVMSMLASGLLLFQMVEIESFCYLALNVPTAVLELALGFYLIKEGLKNSLMAKVQCPE